MGGRMSWFLGGDRRWNELVLGGDGRWNEWVMLRYGSK